MKNKKYFVVIFIILYVIVVLTACQKKPLTVSKQLAKFVTENNITYEIIEKSVDKEIVSVYARVGSVGNPDESLQVTDINIPEKITYNEVEYPVLVIGSLAFSQSRYSIIRISEGITEIENFAFQRAQSNVIYLPSTIEKIGEYAFLDCLNLSTIHLEAIIPPKLGSYAFMAYQKTTKKYIPSPILKILIKDNAKINYQDINKYPDWEIYQGNLR